MKTAAPLIALTLASAAFAQSSSELATKQIDARTAAARTAAEGDAGKKIWNGVAADRKNKTVTIFGVATNIKPTDPVEFFVAPIISGKDYESLAVTTAMPSDVKAALEFIGMKPGRPIDANADRYWPRGPRVTMTFNLPGGPARAEDLVFDARAHRVLVPGGLIFAGSFERVIDGKPQLAADFAEARPISPVYNDAAALLELPRQATQSGIYGSQKPSPAFVVKAGDAIDITLAPAAGADAVADYDAVVRTAMIDGRPRFAFEPHQSPDDKTTVKPTAADDLPTFVAGIGKLADGTCDWFTTADLDPALPVTAVRNLYAVLQAVEKDRGIKLDAPPTSGLYHRAYFPDPAWRDRATRLGEPWELFLTRDTAGQLTAKLERQIDDPANDAAKVVQSTQPADPAALAAHVAANASQWSRTVFVYPPADLTHGELMAWVGPVRAVLPRVFVFPPGDAATQPTP